MRFLHEKCEIRVDNRLLEFLGHRSLKHADGFRRHKELRFHSNNSFAGVTTNMRQFTTFTTSASFIEFCAKSISGLAITHILQCE